MHSVVFNSLAHVCGVGKQVFTRREEIHFCSNYMAPLFLQTAGAN